MIFNGHTDILTDITYSRLNGQSHIFQKKHLSNFNHSQVNGAIFVIWTDEAHSANSRDWVSQQLIACDAMLQEEQSVIVQALNFKDYQKIIAEDKIALFLGMEGLSHIQEDLDLIDHYYAENGLRHVGLTWNEENTLAKSFLYTGGLSPLGKKAIKRIEKLGIILDVSHLNDEGFWDIISLSSRPIIASHSNSRTLRNHPRNLSDEMLKAIQSTNGLVGINAYKEFVAPTKENQTIDQLVEHLDYMASLIGVEHLTFGFDFMDFLPEESLGSLASEEQSSSTVPGLASEKDIPTLLQAMRSRGFTENDIKKIASENYQHFLQNYLTN